MRFGKMPRLNDAEFEEAKKKFQEVAVDAVTPISLNAIIVAIEEILKPFQNNVTVTVEKSNGAPKIITIQVKFNLR